AKVPWPEAARNSNHIECGFHRSLRCTESCVVTILKSRRRDVPTPMISLSPAVPAAEARGRLRASQRLSQSGDDYQCISQKSEYRRPPFLPECRSRPPLEKDASLRGAQTCLRLLVKTVPSHRSLRRLIEFGQKLSRLFQTCVWIFSIPSRMSRSAMGV